MATSDPLASLEGDMSDFAPNAEHVNGDVKDTSRLPNVAVNASAEEKTEAVNGDVQKCDVLVVGAGFSGESCGWLWDMLIY